MNTNDALALRLSDFQTVSLEEMKKIRLMNRTDTKYVFATDTLDAILAMSAGEYMVQKTAGSTVAPYHTTYLDTPDMAMYLAHQCGHRTREKIRVRTYLASNLSFLEVKNKNNKGRTDKRRIMVEDPEALPEPEADGFLSRNAWYMMQQLTPTLENRFQRVTLVNKAMTERLTIDTGIRFRNLSNGNYISLPHLVVMELKRDGRAYSPILSTLQKLRVRPCGFSKYCMGCAMTDSELKQNRFKKRIRKIRHIAES